MDEYQPRSAVFWRSIAIQAVANHHDQAEGGQDEGRWLGNVGHCRGAKVREDLRAGIDEQRGPFLGVLERRLVLCQG